MKKVTVVIPALNEEKAIGGVIDNIKKADLGKNGYEVSILVVNNGSTDKTKSIAQKSGAKVICEMEKGKGNALRKGFMNIPSNADYVVMMDADDTYHPEEIPRMIEPLESGFCDVVVGSRLEGKINGHSMSFSHRLANWFFTFITRHFYGANVTDTCTGYFAWKADVVRKLNGHIKSGGFAIEAEMIAKMARLGYKIYSVPITYSPRKGESKLSPIGDGLKITWMLIKNMSWMPEPEGK